MSLDECKWKFVLRQEDGAPNKRDHKPIPRKLNCRRRKIRTFSTPGSSRTVRERPVDENGAGAVDIRDRNNALVQCIITPISNQLIQLAIIAILITATLAILLAQTIDGLGLVHVRGRVVEAIGMCVRVAVDTVEPERREDSECACGEEEDWRDS